GARVTRCCATSPPTRSRTARAASARATSARSAGRRSATLRAPSSSSAWSARSAGSRAPTASAGRVQRTSSRRTAGTAALGSASRSDTAVDAAWMRRAPAPAERGWARTRPNPMVGAVVVRDEGVGGEGWHAEYGGPHAEVVALEAAGERARGATLYVTLEPCNHHGRTPPCTDAVLRSGVARVVIATLDPNPVARGGIER